ncbi:hypothetical protein DUI87_24875 [Hirundo rustica rustica]|uniref:Uncharacterized protein n=1 Tax=Hirundo rustica rustica TaxID=333673 RepID=A0A3M0JBW1_HIRRU|nr:hypothetical protein DUI87_24875 [Hirundo rustica rustica]
MSLVTLVKTILQNAKVVNDELDADTGQRMQHRSKFLSQQMTRMLEELEYKAVEQTAGSWGPVTLTFLSGPFDWDPGKSCYLKIYENKVSGSTGSASVLPEIYHDYEQVI